MLVMGNAISDWHCKKKIFLHIIFIDDTFLSCKFYFKAGKWPVDAFLSFVGNTLLNMLEIGLSLGTLPLITFILRLISQCLLYLSSVSGIWPESGIRVFCTMFCTLLFPQVHCCLHLAVYQVYVKMQKQRTKEERRGYDLYRRMQRDRGGTLCSPYSVDTFDIS